MQQSLENMQTEASKLLRGQSTVNMQWKNRHRQSQRQYMLCRCTLEAIGILRRLALNIITP